MRRNRRPLYALVVLLAILLVGYLVQSLRSGSDADHQQRSTSTSTRAANPADSGDADLPSWSGRTVGYAQLPQQARHTIDLIKAGGPFPYDRDGIVFRNAEHRLPKERSGYYHEYTVPTPGEKDRGARRIIAGSSGEYYYTADHYESFQRVEVGR